MTDHPSVDDLADLDAGVSSAAQAHVSGCADCQRALSGLAAVRAALRGLPTEPMPPDVSARIDAELAAERARVSAPATVVPLSSRRRAPVLTWVAAAAAALVLFGGGALLVSNLDDGQAQQLRAGSKAAPGPEHQQVVRATGLDYRAATLADQLPALLGQVPPSDSSALRGDSTGAGALAPATAPSAETYASNQSKSGGRVLSDRAARDSQLAALKQPAALAACLVRALGADLGEPIAVDLAQFNGEPAVLVALPALGRTDKVDIYVLDPACPEGAFVYFARLPLPAPR